MVSVRVQCDLLDILKELETTSGFAQGLAVSSSCHYLRSYTHEVHPAPVLSVIQAEYAGTFIEYVLDLERLGKKV